MPMPARQLLAASRETRLPAVLSRDAGRYLCNYLSWRSAESGVRLAAFIHVPKVARFSRPKKISNGATSSAHSRASGNPALGPRFRRSKNAALSTAMRGDERGLRSRISKPARRKFTAADLLRAGEKILVALNAAVNRT
jgi:pyroglutamyl-peptidase